MNKFVKALLIVLIVALLGVFLYSGYQLTKTIHQYNEADRYYSTQSGKYASFSETPQDSSPQNAVSRPGTPGQEQGDDAPAMLQEISPRIVDFKAMLQDNADVRGWLYSPDTVIDYPVAQAKDNDYYLHRLLDRSYNPNGTLFIDYRCAGDFSGRHTVIYGHHMQNGSMLASITEYKKQEYYDEHPVMYLNTPDGNYRLDVFSGFVTWYDSRIYLFDFIDDQEFEEWYTLMQSYSDFESQVELSPTDRIVTLSTCTYEYDNARYVLMAKLIPIG